MNHRDIHVAEGDEPLPFTFVAFSDGTVLAT